MKTQAAQVVTLEVNEDEAKKILQERAERLKAEKEDRAKKLAQAAKQAIKKDISDRMVATHLSLKRIPLEILDEACRAQTADSIILDIMEQCYGKTPLSPRILKMLVHFPALSDLLKRSKDAEKRLKFRTDSTARRKADKERKEQEDREWRTHQEREREKKRHCMMCNNTPCRCSETDLVPTPLYQKRWPSSWTATACLLLS